MHRGQQGQVFHGKHPGGRCYGYTNKPVEDFSRKGKYGRNEVLHVDLEVNEAEAAVVRRIFEMSAAESGLAKIAKTLNHEGILSPQPPRSRSKRAWCTSSLREMLYNERYRGQFIWNKTKKKRNPKTGRKVSKARPESEWVHTPVPDWRIVSEELWDAVHMRLKRINESGAHTLGGQSRTQRSRTYLFSGLLKCGACGSKMVIAQRRCERRAEILPSWSPFPRHCANAITIRRDRLEEQLVSSIRTQIRSPGVIDHITDRVYKGMLNRNYESGTTVPRQEWSSGHLGDAEKP